MRVGREGRLRYAVEQESIMLHYEQDNDFSLPHLLTDQKYVHVRSHAQNRVNGEVQVLMFSSLLAVHALTVTNFLALKHVE